MNHLSEFIKRRAFVIPTGEEDERLLEGLKGTDGRHRRRGFRVIIVFHPTFCGHQLKALWQGAKTPQTLDNRLRRHTECHRRRGGSSSVAKVVGAAQA